MSTGTTLVLCDRRSIYHRADLFKDKEHVVMFHGYQDFLKKVRVHACRCACMASEISMRVIERCVNERMISACT